MRKILTDLTEVKNQILLLKGKYVLMEVNHGRKKIRHYEGVVEDIYNSVFVVRLSNATTNEKMSYSFSDVLCGDVKIAVK